MHLHPRLNLPAWQRFLLAGGLFLVAAAARFIIVPADLDLPYLAFYPGLLLAIFLCGSGPALFFIVLSVLGGMVVDVYPLLASGGFIPAMAGATQFLVASVALLISVAFFQYHGMWWREGTVESPDTVAQGESWLAGVVNSAMDAIVSVDERQRIVVFNPAAERMFGYPAEQMIGYDFDRLIGEGGTAAHALWGDDLGKMDTSRRFSGSLGLLSARRRDGSQFPIEASISQGMVNGVRIFTVIMRDISERTEARRALAEQEERFRAFMTHSPLASWLVDGDGCFQYVNPVFYTMFGVGSDEVLGKRISEIYPAELAAQQLRNNQLAIDSGQALEVIEPGVRADGSPGTFLVFKFSIRNAAGAALVCANALDITERQRIEALLVDTNKRLSMVAEEQADHLRSLAAELTRVEQNERDELSEMLHDHVQPLLIA
ncbi:MAG: PAS domain S-box protein, partial [Betaproteobacteria bacterium]|nr:PAS domain S-box protein [Betaproteobacteria bacterium]